MPAPQPELVYSSGFLRNPRLVMGPSLLIVGGVITVVLWLPLLSHSGTSRVMLTSDIAPFIVFLGGVVLTYFAYFRWPVRLELADETLSWFAPFHRLRGQAAVADIEAIWTTQDFQWPRSRSVIVFGNGRKVRIHDSVGINAFVAALVARSPKIDLTDWEAQRRNDGQWVTRSAYFGDDD